MTRMRYRQLVFKSLLGLLVVILPLPKPVQAAPEGEHVVRGDVTFSRTGDLTTITASHNSIINYGSFDIATRETVQFVQPGSTARVLNQIMGGYPTRIEGSLLANGIVYLVNPAGVFFTRTAVVDVGGIYAAAAQISNRDFLNNTDLFLNASGRVENWGTIRAESVNLIGRQVANYGTILADSGLLTMVAGEDIYITKHGSHIMVKLEGAGAPADAGGAPAVENTGVADAGAGEIVIAAGDVFSLAFRNSGLMKAKDVTVDGGAGRVEVGGSIDASDAAPGAAGGSVKILGGEVALRDAHIDASGNAGGGTVLVGGDYQGDNPDVRNAQYTSVDADTTISADALVAGDGGKVILWADDFTLFFGNISARGGPQGGSGGFVETSGKALLFVALPAYVDTAAPAGTPGMWLLDPTDVILSTAVTANMVGDPNWVPGAGPPAAGNIQISVIEGVLDDNGGAVTVATAGAGGGAENGSIRVNDPIGVDLSTHIGATTSSLTLNADSFIVIDDPITVTSADNTGDVFTLTLNATTGVTISQSIENLQVNGTLELNTTGTTFNNTATITTNGGNVNINNTGVVTVGAGIDAGAGDVSIEGASSIAASGGALKGANLTAKTQNDTGGSITIDNAANDFTTVDLRARNAADAADAAGALAYVDADGFDVAAAQTTSTVTLTGGDAITDSGTLTGTTLTAKTLKDGGAAITLDETTNDFTTVDLRARNAADGADAAGALAYRDADGFDVAAAQTTSTVTLTGGDAITDSGTLTGTTLTAKTLKDGGAAITLDVATNDFTIVDLRARNAADAADAAGALEYRDATGFDVAAAQTTSTVTLTGGDAITDSGTLTGTTLTAKTLKDGGAAITLDVVTNDFTTVDLRSRNAADGADAAGALAYRDADGFDVAAAQTTSTLTLTGGDTITDSGALVGTTLTVKTLNDGKADIELDIATNNCDAIDFRARNAADGDTGTGDLTYRDIDGFAILMLETTGDIDLGGGGDLVFNTPLPGGADFILNAGVGKIIITADFGTVGTPMKHVELSGAQCDLGADIYSAASTLIFNLPVVLTANTSHTDAGGGITFNNTIEGDGGGPWDLTLTTTLPGDDITFNNTVGAANSLDVLQTTTNAGDTIINTATVNGATLDFNSAVLIDTNTTLTGTTSIDFAGTVDSQAAETNDLTLNSPTTGFHGQVGNTQALDVLQTDAAGTTTIDTDVVNGATLDFNDDVVTTAASALTGTTLVDFAKTLTIGDAAAEALTVVGATANFNGAVDSGATFANDLTVNATTTLLAGQVGNAAGGALGQLQTDAAGTTTINTDVVKGATLDFNDAVVIDVDTALTGTTSIDFAGTVDSQAAETNDLTLNSPTTGFHGQVGNTQALDVLQTDAAGTTTIDTDVVNGATLDFNDDVVTTAASALTGTTLVDFAKTLTIGDAAAEALTVVGATANFNGAVDSGATFANDLTVNATTTLLAGQVGNAAGGALGQLQTDAAGTTTINTDVVNGATLDFNDAVVIDVDTALTGTTSIDFAGTVDSQAAETNDLTLNSPTTGFHGQVGNTQALDVLQTDAAGTTTIDTDVVNGATLDFNDAVVIDVDTTLTGTTVVDFAGTVDGDGGGPWDLDINGDAVFGDGAGDLVGDTNPLDLVDVSGTTIFNAAGTAANPTVETAGTDTQTYHGAATLGADVTLDGATVTFNGTVDGAFDLDINGNAVFGDGAGDLVGDTTPLDLVDVSGTTIFNAAGTAANPTVETTGTQVYGGAVTLGAATVLKTAGAAGNDVTFASTVQSPGTAYSLVVDTDDGGAGDIDVQNHIGGGGNLLASVDFDAFDINMKDVTTTGVQSYNAAGVILTSSTYQSDGGQIDFTGNWVLTETSLIDTEDGLGGNNAGVVDLRNATVSASVLLVDLTIDTSTPDAFDGGDVHLGSFGNAPGPQYINDLTLDTSSVGGNPGQIFFHGTIITTGDQTYNGPVMLANDAVFTSLAGGIAFNSFIDAVDDAVAGTSAHGLTVRTPGGDTTFGDEVGGGSANQLGADDDGLEFVTTDDTGVGGSLFVGADVTTAGGTMTFNDPVVLTADATLTDSGGTGVTFNNTVDGNGAAWALNVVTTGGGTTTFNNLVGDTTPLASLTTDTTGNPDGTTVFNAAGTAANPTVETTGAQVYHDAVTLGADVTLDGGTVTFNGTVDGAFELDINGDAVFGDGAGDLVGDTTPLDLVDVSGTTVFNAAGTAANPTVETAGTDTQTYHGAVTLGANVTLDGGTVTFEDTVNGAFDLDVNGNAVFGDGAGDFVGNTAALASVDVSGTTTFNAGNAGGAEETVETTGTQVYGGAVTLGAATTLKTAGAAGNDVTFASTVQSPGTAYSLVVDTDDGGAGDIDVQDHIGGGGNVLASVDFDAFNINMKDVTTTGAQSYNAAGVILTSSTYQSDGGQIDFTGDWVLTETSLIDTEDGGGNDAGVVDLRNAIVSASVLLVDLTIDTSTPDAFDGGDVHLGSFGNTPGPEYINDLTLDTSSVGGNPGQIFFYGTIITMGDQTYNGPVMLAADAVFTSLAGGIAFNSFIDAVDDAVGGTSAHGLTVRTPGGDTTFGDEVGGGSANQPGADDDGLEFVTTDDTGVFGSLSIGADVTAAGGTMTFNDPVVLAADVTLTDTGGTGVTFNNTVDTATGLAAGAGDLTLVVTGPTTFVGAVGSNAIPGTTKAQLGSGVGAALTVNSAGATTFQSTVETASGITQANGAGLVTFQQDVTVEAGDTPSTFNANVTLDGLTFASNGAVTFGNAAADQVTLSGGDVTVRTTGAGDTVTFNAKVDGRQDLTLDVQDGGTATTFAAAVGSGVGTEIGDGAGAALTINSAGPTTFESTLETFSGITQANGAGLVTFENNVTIGAGNTPSTFNANVTFDNATSVAATLLFASDGAVTFGNAAADQVTLSATNAGQTTMPVTVRTTGAGDTVTFNAEVDGRQDLTLDVQNVGTATTFAAAVGSGVGTEIGDGAGAALTINSAGPTTFESTLETFSGITQANGAGLVTFENNVTIGAGDTDTTLNANVTFDNATSVAATLLFASDGAVTFGNAAADQVTLSATNAGQTTMPVTVRTSGAGDTVTFNAKVDGNQDLTIETVGGANTVFNARVGDVTPLATLTTDAPGTTRVNTDEMSTQGGTMTFNDPFVLLTDATLNDSGTTGITFNNTVNGDGLGPWTLDVVTTGGGDTTFNDRVGGTWPLASLTTDTLGNPDGTTFFNSAGTVAAPTVTTTGTQTYHDPVELQAKTVLQTTNSDVTFNETVDGAQDLVVNAGTGDVACNDHVGGTTPLTSVSITSNDALDPMPAGARDLLLHDVRTTGNQVYSVTSTIELVAVNPPLAPLVAPPPGPVFPTTWLAQYSAGGRIEFNTNRAGNLVPPLLATIFCRQGNVVINAGGDFKMYSNDKLTVVGNETLPAMPGDLGIVSGGNVLLGDLTALNNITVNAFTSIQPLARPLGQVRNSTGFLDAETPTLTRSDYVAGGNISFNQVALGQFTYADPDAHGTPAGNFADDYYLELQVTMTRNSMFFGGQVLDWPAEGPSATNPSDVMASAAATLALVAPQEIGLTSAQKEVLRRLSVNPRDLTPGEIISMLVAGYINDYGFNWGRDAVYVAPERFTRGALAPVLEAYTKLFFRETVDPATGKPRREDRTPALLAGLQEPWNDFQGTKPATQDRQALMRGFYDFLMSNRGKYPEVFTTAEQISGLLDAIAQVGLTEREFDMARQGLLAPITPEGMNVGELASLIERLAPGQ